MAHTGEGIGGTYVSWAECLPEEARSASLLSNHLVEDIGAMAGTPLNAVRPLLSPSAETATPYRRVVAVRPMIAAT